MKRFGHLLVTAVLLSENQTCLWREERGQSLILFAVRDEKTNETGHVVYWIETDKRDINEEGIATDNPALFAEDHPDTALLQDALSFADENTPTERTEEHGDLLSACWENEQDIAAWCE